MQLCVGNQRGGARGARPQGPGEPALAYRYRLALRRPYRYRYRPVGAGGWWPRRAVGWVGSGEGSEGAI